jgi:hypothetical protein
MITTQPCGTQFVDNRNRAIGLLSFAPSKNCYLGEAAIESVSHLPKIPTP